LENTTPALIFLWSCQALGFILPAVLAVGEGLVVESLHWVVPQTILLGCSTVQGSTEDSDAHVLFVSLPDGWQTAAQQGAALEGAQLLSSSPIAIEVRDGRAALVFNGWSKVPGLQSTSPAEAGLVYLASSACLASFFQLSFIWHHVLLIFL
jgi:hypothetical protein